MGTLFKPGQRVYTADGRIGEFVVAIGESRNIIRQVFEASDGGGEPYEYTDGVVEVGQLFPQPPLAKLDASVAEMNATADRLRSEIRALEAEKRTFGQDHKEREARIARHGQLETLDRFLAGEITHTVLQAGYGTGLKILPLAEALKVDPEDRLGRREPEMKLLSLFGSSAGDLSWRINTYRDGSGHWVEMVPCVSEEAARGVVAAKLDAIWAGFRTDSRQPWVLRDGIAAADELGIIVPDDIREAVASHKRAADAAAIAKCEAELAAARAQATS